MKLIVLLFLMGSSVKTTNLKAIFLEYEDGTIIAVPEDKTLKVGTAFMKVIGKEQIAWNIVKTEKQNVAAKLKKFFTI